MTTSKSVFERTLTALQERGIDFDRGKVQAVFEHPVTSEDASRWVDDNLGEATLLSKEEVALYIKLQNNGITKTIEEDRDTAVAKPFLDADLRNAVTSLRQSTAAIEKQTEILKQQWKHVESYRRKNCNTETQATKSKKQIERRQAVEKQHISVTAEELLQDLNRRLAGSQEQVEKAARGVKAETAEHLRKDDQLLERLETLLNSNPSEELERKGVQLRTKKLTAKLVDYMTNTIECRLNRIYLETLNDNVTGPLIDNGSSNDAVAMKDELDSLYSEIRILAGMATQQEFESPIMKALRDQEQQLKQESERRLDYVLRNLNILTENIEQRVEKLQKLAGHRRAVDTIATSFENDLKLPDSEEAQLSSKAIHGAARHPQTEALGLTSIATPDFLALLKYLGVSMPLDSGYGQIQRAIGDRSEKMNDAIRRLHDGFDISVLSQLEIPEVATRQLLASLQAGATTGTPTLVDEESEELLSELEKSIATIVNTLEAVDLNKVHDRDRGFQDFLERWNGSK